MSLADTINTMAADIATIKTTLATPPAVTVDLTPALDAVAGVKSDTAAILADLTPTPATPPAA